MSTEITYELVEQVVEKVCCVPYPHSLVCMNHECKFGAVISAPTHDGDAVLCTNTNLDYKSNNGETCKLLEPMNEAQEEMILNTMIRNWKK